MCENIIIRYIFEFEDKTSREYSITLNGKTLDIITGTRSVPPQWTKLDNHKCPNCSFDSRVVANCPVAVNLSELIEEFRDRISYEKVDVTIFTEGRQYRKQTTMQEGLSSIIGIYMVTSGCPVMQKLKPMVRHHLPFATLDETNYRVLSMYLLAQYFIFKKGGKPDWELNKLLEVYEDIRFVNQSFCQRILDEQVQDASLNAVVILDTFADYIPLSISEYLLDEIEVLFSGYLSEIKDN